MKKLYIYGDSYCRFEGATRFSETLDFDEMTEGHKLYLASKNTDDAEEAFDMWMDGVEEYSLVQAIYEISRMEGSDRMAEALDGKQVEVYVEELVFGVGSTENEAKLAYLEVTDNNS